MLIDIAIAVPKYNHAQLAFSHFAAPALFVGPFGLAPVEHGKTRIDNNLTEEAIRPCKLGTKNWLLVGSPAAEKTSAVIYTILESCRRLGIEPMTYLSDVLRRLPSMTNLEAEELAPKNWKADHIKTPQDGHLRNTTQRRT